MVVPPRTLVAGVPAQVVRELTEQEIAWKVEGTKSYQELTRRSPRDDARDLAARCAGAGPQAHRAAGTAAAVDAEGESGS